MTFTIQYQDTDGDKMQTFDSRNRDQLARHLSRFNKPIIAVFEQATPITNAIRVSMSKLPHNHMSRAALSFIGSRTP